MLGNIIETLMNLLSALLFEHMLFAFRTSPQKAQRDRPNWILFQPTDPEA